MKNISEQTLEAIAAIVKSPEAIEQLPSGTRQALVESPKETMAGLTVRSDGLTLGEKRERSFAESYQKALKIRDFFRGWGDYGSKDGMSHFGHLCYRVCETAKNSALKMLVGTDEEMSKRWGDLSDLVRQLSLQLTAFAVRENIDLHVMRKLDLLGEALKAAKPELIFEAAVCLWAFVGGIEYSNDLMLASVDKLDGR